MLHGFARNLNSEHCVSGWNNIKKSQILTKISNKTSFREFKGRQTIFFFSDFEKKKKILKVFLHDITYIFHFLHAKSYARLSYSMKMFTVEIDFSKFFCSTLKKKTPSRRLPLQADHQCAERRVLVWYKKYFVNTCCNICWAVCYFFFKNICCNICCSMLPGISYSGFLLLNPVKNFGKNNVLNKRA